MGKARLPIDWLIDDRLCIDWMDWLFDDRLFINYLLIESIDFLMIDYSLISYWLNRLIIDRLLMIDYSLITLMNYNWLCLILINSPIAQYQQSKKEQKRPFPSSKHWSNNKQWKAFLAAICVADWMFCRPWLMGPAELQSKCRILNNEPIRAWHSINHQYR